MAAVTFGRIKSRSNFLCSRAALVIVLGKEKPQAAPDIIRKSCFQNQKLDKEKHKSPSLDPQRNPPLLSHPHRHLYHNQNHQGTTTSEHVVQHTEDEQLSQNQNHQQQLLFHHQQPPSPRQPPKKRTYLPSSEHANKMGESSSHQNNLSRTIPSSSSRLGIGLRNTSAGGGEIVEVQGGHIVRSTGRKDRHSKVCTAKGPRDRRVRLAAHTAIQFYDVQDRLGYDRPSKAVDWLIKEAKSAIDELAELPAWNPLTTCSATPNAALFHHEAQNKHEEEQHLGNDLMIVNENQGFNGAGSQNAHDSSFLPPSLDSDAIADTIKSFFPMGASAGASSSAMQFQSFQSPDLLPRSTQSQDLRLSLQSFHDPVMLHHHNQNQQNHTEQPHSQAHHVLLSGTPLGFDGGGWAEHHQQAAELSRYSRLGAWNAVGDATVNGGASSAGYLFNLPPLQQQAAQAPLLQQLFSHNQFFSQRGPLQSSNTSSIRAWMDPAAVTIANTMADHNISQLHQHQQQQNQSHHHQSSVVPIYPSSIGFSSGIGGFSGFHIPARIQGEEEEHDGYSDKPSSASSDSHH